MKGPTQLAEFHHVPALLRFQHLRDAVWRVAEGVSYSSVPNSSYSDIHLGVVLQFYKYFEAAENIKDPQHIPTIICKRGEFELRVMGVAGLGYQ